MTQSIFLRGATLLSLLLAVAPALRGEVMIHSEKNVPLSTPIQVVVPEEAISDADYAKGKTTIFVRVDSERNNWTMYTEDKPPKLINSEKDFVTTTMPKASHYSLIGNGKPLALEFPLPEKRNADDPLELVLGKGICSWEQPNGKFNIEIWTGARLNGESLVDKMNRNCIITLDDLGDKVKEYRFEFPDGSVVKSAKNTVRRRLADNKPFTVKAVAVLTDGSEIVKNIAVKPHETTTPPPISDGEILVGLCVYKDSIEKRTDAHPEGFKLYNRDKNAEIAKLTEEGEVNLIVPWFNPTPEEIAKAADKGIYTMTIYQNMSADDAQKSAAAGKNRYWLNNNIGEYAGYLYQAESSAKACNINTTGDLRECRDFFINNFINRGVRNYHRGYPYIFSTSGSTVATYEMAGGMDFILCELYALGAQNLAWSSAEMRGAARKWKPEFWGGWLATEWQSCHIPYKAKQKYDILKVGLYQQYLMGSRIIILESGSQSTQAGEFTAKSEEKYPKRNYNDTEAPVIQYKKEMTDFHRFVKDNPRSSGTPETNIAAVLGNNSGFCGLYIDWFTVFSQYAQARKNPNWLYGDPERTDVAVQNLIFPRPQDALGGYSNQWLGGSPFGQCDVVNIDEESRLSDIDRYKFLFYGGWNTMTPEIMKTLRAYAEQGGTVFLSLPHFSTRADREYKEFKVEDLISGGDLSSLLNVKVLDREIGGGLLKSEEFKLKGVVRKEPFAKVELGKDVETVISAGTRPLLVRQKIGKGAVYVLLTWEYPGKESLSKYYSQILGGLADKFVGEVRVAELEAGDKAPDYIAYAVWPEAVYLLNTDCVKKRSFRLTVGGKTETITLKPTEFRIVKR